MDKRITIIAGPCSIESKDQIIRIANKLKAIGVDVLRGGAFKPRTDPDSFQGLGDKGIEYLIEAKKETGLPIISELMTIDQVRKYASKIDIIQVGSRNMYNYELLKELSKYDTPVMLKRGLSATYDEWLLASKYITNGRNKKVILCERGIRSFDNCTRNVLDIQAIPYIKTHSSLPIVVDPSHSSGNRYMIEPICLASVIAGCDGLMIETHDNPDESLSDKQQTIGIEKLEVIIKKVRELEKFISSNNKKN